MKRDENQLLQSIQDANLQAVSRVTILVVLFGDYPGGFFDDTKEAPLDDRDWAVLYNTISASHNMITSLCVYVSRTVRNENVRLLLDALPQDMNTIGIHRLANLKLIARALYCFRRLRSVVLRGMRCGIAPEEGVSHMELRHLTLVLEKQRPYLRRFTFMAIPFDNPTPDLSNFLMALATLMTLRNVQVLQPSQTSQTNAPKTGHCYRKETFVSRCCEVCLTEFEMGLTQVGPLLYGVWKMLSRPSFPAANVQFLCAETSIHRYIHALSCVIDNINVVFRMLSERIDLFCHYQRWQLIKDVHGKVVDNYIGIGPLQARQLIMHIKGPFSKPTRASRVAVTPKQTRFVGLENSGKLAVMDSLEICRDNNTNVSYKKSKKQKIT